MFFKYVPLLTTKDQEYAAKIRDVLAQNNIKCRTRSTNARINPAPNPGMPVGGIGNGAMQWSTIILEPSNTSSEIYLPFLQQHRGCDVQGGYLLCRVHAPVNGPRQLSG